VTRRELTSTFEHVHYIYSSHSNDVLASLQYLHQQAHALYIISLHSLIFRATFTKSFVYSLLVLDGKEAHY
jgi:hypothetical protein